MKLCKKRGVMLTKSQKKTFDSGGNWGEGNKRTSAELSSER